MGRVGDGLSTDQGLLKKNGGGRGAAGGLWGGPDHLVAGVKCSITEAGDHVLHQGGAPGGERRQCVARSFTYYSLTLTLTKGLLCARDHLCCMRYPGAGGGVRVRLAAVCCTCVRPSLVSPHTGLAQQVPAAPAQARCWASAAPDRVSQLESGSRGPSQCLSSRPAAPAPPLPRADFPVSGKVQATALTVPYLSYSPSLTDLHLGTSSKSCAQTVPVCSLPKAFLHRKVFGNRVRESNGSTLCLFHSDHPQFTGHVRGHTAGEKESEPRSPDSKLLLRCEDTRCDWHVGTFRRWLSFLSQAPTLLRPHSCWGGEALAQGEGIFEGSRHPQRYPSDLPQTSLSFPRGLRVKSTGKGWPVWGGWSREKASGAGKEAQRGGLDPPPGPSVATENAAWSNRSQKTEGQRIGPALNLLCDLPPAPCPL